MFQSCPAAVAWLHDAHYGSADGHLMPWLSDPEQQGSETRRGALENVVTNAATGQRLSTSKPREDGKRKPSSLKKSKESDNSALAFSRSRLSLAARDSRGQLYIPLLLSDVVCAAVHARRAEESSVREVAADFVIGIAVRAERSMHIGEDADFSSASMISSNSSGDAGGPPLRQVWLLCVGNCSAADMQGILFELGSFGALRWDFQDAYELTSRNLGSGGCGTVRVGQAKTVMKNTGNAKMDKTNVAQVAVKTLNRSEVQMEHVIRREIEFLAKVHGHPNLSTLFGVFCVGEESSSDLGLTDSVKSDGKQLWWFIVMDLCSEGDLWNLMDIHGHLQLDDAAQILMGVLSALAHLHSLRIAHRDVKCENILLTQHEPILADLGIAAHLHDFDSMQEGVGTPGYAAPEIVLGKAYNEKVDIFATGVVFYYMLTGKQPFNARSIGKVLHRTAKCKVSFQCQVFQGLSGSVLTLLKSLLAKHADERPTASLALEALMVLPGPDDHAAAGDFAISIDENQEALPESIKPAAPVHALPDTEGAQRPAELQQVPVKPPCPIKEPHQLQWEVQSIQPDSEEDQNHPTGNSTRGGGDGSLQKPAASQQRRTLQAATSCQEPLQPPWPQREPLQNEQEPPQLQQQPGQASARPSSDDQVQAVPPQAAKPSFVRRARGKLTSACTSSIASASGTSSSSSTKAPQAEACCSLETTPESKSAAYLPAPPAQRQPQCSRPVRRSHA
eukprot:TRINITY_DN2765_c0_g1_i7.p1 TRINITY_DN2765_c0_g1~~TRINITY_DN2765_c0_g1_i7.p1  ORF type:complete len:732 (+),score=153.77 TRINITY_DN2765_c0_g1_i7:83-2278(+)